MSFPVPDPRITVTTADNPGYENVGMVTVDLASKSIRKRLGRDVGVEWFTLHVPSVGRMRQHAELSQEALTSPLRTMM